MRQKKKKTGICLSQKDLRRLEEVLLKEKQRILRQGNFTRQLMDFATDTGELSSHHTHIADQGSENFQREFASQLRSIESRSLREIDEALTRIAAGTYGICEQCGEPIPVARLDVVPYARLCMKCAKKEKKPD
ncbi:MAG: TraR/DksA family transcriptional regulator [bacterium]